MLWLGEPPSKAETQSFWSRYFTGNIGRGLTEAQQEERVRLEREFLGSKPPFSQACIACGGSFDWIAAANESGRFWACQKCHRPSTLTAEEWSEEVERKRKAEAAEAAAIAAANTPNATRLALKAAITEGAQAELVARKLNAAFEASTQRVYAAMHAVDDAKEALAKAQNIDGDAVRAAALADAPIEPTAARRAARDAVIAAEEDLQHVQAVRDALGAEANAAKGTLEYATMGVRSAAIACARAHSGKSIATFIADTQKLQVELVARMRGLQFLVNEKLLADTSAGHIGKFFYYGPQHWEVPDAGQQADIAGRWQGAIDRLTRDAGAPAELK